MSAALAHRLQASMEVTRPLGDPGAVYCSQCDNVHPDSRKREPWAWRCMKAPTEPGYGFVDPTYSPDPPYAKCDRINTDGRCSWFTPRRVPEEAA